MADFCLKYLKKKRRTVCLNWKVFVIEIGAKLDIKEKVIFWSEVSPLLGGEYGISDVACDGRIGYLYIDQFDSFDQFLLVLPVLYFSSRKYDEGFLMVWMICV